MASKTQGITFRNVEGTRISASSVIKNSKSRITKHARGSTSQSFKAYSSKNISACLWKIDFYSHTPPGSADECNSRLQFLVTCLAAREWIGTCRLYSCRLTWPNWSLMYNSMFRCVYLPVAVCYAVAVALRCVTRIL